MTRSRRSTCVAIVMVALGVGHAGSAWAQSAISWQAPTSITSADQALSDAASVDYAVAWTGSANSTTVTLSDALTVTFQSGTINGAGLIGIQGSYGICNTGCASYSGTTNAAFNAAVGGFAYDGLETVTMTDLTVGQTYTVQVFSLDDRSCCSSKTQTFTDTSGDSTASFAHGANDYVEGTFVATATTEVIDAIGQEGTGSCNGSIPGGVCTNVNAVVLYDGSGTPVPEPGAWRIFAAGIAVLGLMRSRAVRRWPAKCGRDGPGRARFPV